MATIRKSGSFFTPFSSSFKDHNEECPLKKSEQFFKYSFGEMCYGGHKIIAQ